ncbi:MAG: aminopeptidase [Spirochaetales bacterium]|nr:aminopeptidase [Spirochaetales bacterium]
MTLTDYVQHFARIAMTALNLQPGQRLTVKMEPEHIDAAVVVAEEAYRAGAGYVEIRLESSRLLRARVDHSREEFLDFTPTHRVARNDEIIRDKWALLAIKSPADPAALDGIDPMRSSRVSAAFGKVDLSLNRSLANDESQWTVMALPTPPWAARVMGMGAGEEAMLALWKVLTPILRLDEDDPARYWTHHGETLKARCRALNALRVRELHFLAEGTDLRVPLHERARWHGGGSVTQGGIPFLPNVPTEEVYTAPYAPGVEGRAMITKPVRILKALVEGAWFVFRNGEVIEFGAERGRDVLEAYFAVDAGSRRMGEIALVDATSPIARSNRIFDTILLDENAASHFALGFAYPTCIEGGASMNEDELNAVGASRSQQHTDVMIGSDAMRVEATLADGTKRIIMDNGRLTV